MNNKLPQTPYDAFDGFLKSFAAGNTYINHKEGTIEKEKVQEIYNEFVKFSQEKGIDRKFDEVIEKFRKDKNNSSPKVFDIINHAIWLWCLPNNRKANWAYLNVANKNVSTEKRREINEENNKIYKDELLKLFGVAGGGSGYVQTKTNGVRFVLFLFTEIKDIKEPEKIREKLLEKCKALQGKKVKYDDNYPVPDGVKNLFLHLCDKDSYEPIASTADKEKIVKAFEDFVPFNNATDNDTKIKTIKIFLGEKINLPQGASFYGNSLPLMWKGESTTDLSLLQKLEYKKAMILYGPPGTGKTYTAMELAKEMIVRHFMKRYKDAKKNADKINSFEAKQIAKNSLEECFKVLGNIEREKDNFISYLQFHINYNYEDFIAGQVIKDDCIETKEGFIYDVIKKAERKPEIPYIVILDEINRTDISRVFGELFTAIEKRGENVTLTLPKPKNKSNGQQTQQQNLQSEERLILNLPDNIYFIGTMNEIDFSLERVDFALRRRFIWELHDYNENALENIVNERFEQYVYNEWFKLYKESGKSDEESKKLALQELSSSEKPHDAQKKVKDKIRAFNAGVTLSDFCNSCTNLNKVVEKAMGEAYHIGHAFFAEITTIYIELLKNNVTDDAWKKAKIILWEISIKPTLEAYCGSMDKIEKEKYLNPSKGLFCNAYFKLEELQDDEPDGSTNSETKE